MNIANLEQYVERKNSWGRIFNSKQFSLLNAKDRQSIANSIDADMSPENLTCDGELSRNQVRDRVMYLTSCADQLLAIDPNVTFSEMGV